MVRHLVYNVGVCRQRYPVVGSFSKMCKTSWPLYRSKNTIEVTSNSLAVGSSYFLKRKFLLNSGESSNRDARLRPQPIWGPKKSPVYLKHNNYSKIVITSGLKNNAECKKNILNFIVLHLLIYYLY